MHVVARVPGVGKVGQARQRQAMALDQPIDRTRRLRGDMARKRRVALPLGLGQDIGGQDLRRIVDPRLALQPGAARGNLPARQGGVAARARVAL